MSAYISEQSKRRNEFFDDLLSFITGELVKFGMSEEQAASSAERVALDLHKKWQSHTLVFPKKPELVMTKLKQDVLSEFNGHNISDLIRKYRVSETTFYRWLREERAELKRKLDEQQHQLDL